MEYSVIVQRSGEWYSYFGFNTRRLACQWAENNLNGYDWHVAQNVTIN